MHVQAVELRLAQLVAALSVATDLGTGHWRRTAQCGCGSAVVQGAIDTARRRSGHAHDPLLVDVLLREPSVLSSVEEAPAWDLALESEPKPGAGAGAGAGVRFGPRQIDTALEAMADFVDLKSPELGGHSRAVAVS